MHLAPGSGDAARIARKDQTTVHSLATVPARAGRNPPAAPSVSAMGRLPRTHEGAEQSPATRERQIAMKTTTTLAAATGCW